MSYSWSFYNLWSFHKLLNMNTMIFSMLVIFGTQFLSHLINSASGISFWTFSIYEALPDFLKSTAKEETIPKHTSHFLTPLCTQMFTHSLHKDMLIRLSHGKQSMLDINSIFSVWQLLLWKLSTRLVADRPRQTSVRSVLPFSTTVQPPGSYQDLAATACTVSVYSCVWNK